MRKKNYKKILRSCCFLVACCVILAGAAAPLTAFAAEDDGSAELDVAQETRTLSGTWTFNDVLTVPEGFDSRYEIELDFLVSPGILVSDDSSSVELTSAPYVGQYFVMVLDGSGYFSLVYDNSDSSLMLPYSSGSGIYWDFTYLFVSELTGSDIPELKGWGQTIIFTRPQAVPAMFYDWFVANAVKQQVPADNLLESIFSAIRAPLSWVGSVLGALISGPMSELLPLFAVFVAVSAILVAVVLIKRFVWGS